MSLSRLFIHATNVHNGGGKTLLIALLAALPSQIATVLSVDKRMELAERLVESNKLSIKAVKPTVWQRLRAEYWLAAVAKQHDVVLCFGNLPPLLPVRSRVIVFVQNRYLVESVNLSHLPVGTRLRLLIERRWLKLRIACVDVFIVQTPSMQRLLQAQTDRPVHILPFVSDAREYMRNAEINLHHLSSRANQKIASDFLYVASGEAHKNHHRLIEAWCLLASEGIFPSLVLTLDMQQSPQLLTWIGEQTAKYDLRIVNRGALPHAEVVSLYSQCGALIYPSIFESFGLPLIEAAQAGLPILASELDYVRDVIDAVESFDPLSAISIARSVKRYMGRAEPHLPLCNAADFLKYILSKV